MIIIIIIIIITWVFNVPQLTDNNTETQITASGSYKVPVSRRRQQPE
jgi:hypothetical protein